MNRKNWFVIGMIMVCLLSGCGNTGDAAADGNTEETAEDRSTETGQPSESSGEAPAEEVPPAEAAELSEEEKQFFTDFIQANENYGFLLSDYDVPEDVNIVEVLYSGAGFGEWIPEEDIPLYLEAAQQEALQTDCMKLTRQGIEELLQRKLGIGLEDMSGPLDMLYLAETDSYYNEAGDTNYAPFACTGGIREGETYRLHFAPAADWLEGYGDRETVLVKTEDGYRFLSNHILAGW
ncbi:MAG: hypothetical protein K2O34_03995 [Acetatifactor sp.]|nr:hypothetical protein [Acetatifactor sp.]